FDLAIHLAGIIDIGSGHRKLVERVNVQGTENVATWCRSHGIKLIYCSSVHAIPPLPHWQVMAEPAVFDPNKVKGLYSKTKAEATRRILEQTTAGLDAMVAMPAGIIGPGERRLSNIGQLIVDLICRGLVAYIDGKYNFVDVRDVSAGIVRMINHWDSGQTYVLAGREITVANLLRTVSEASGAPMPKVRLPYGFVLATSHLAELHYLVHRKKPLYTHYSIKTLRTNCRFSSQKAHDAFGYTVRPLEDSLREMTSWIMDHYIEQANITYRAVPFRAAVQATLV
ncbi:MAG: NAD-dependent epimerase/dehydratase family protein, partial [Propionibacteriaceae bacterium]|nr:NAD-dependent epimerase/dehydratase family protein [Propionibacteriaceae bacterium]